MYYMSTEISQIIQIYSFYNDAKWFSFQNNTQTIVLNAVPSILSVIKITFSILCLDNSLNLRSIR